jgi:hypothetical protein
MPDDPLDKLIEKTALSLGEHFEAVQILATRTEADGETYGYSRGCGNWHARIGLAQVFMERAHAREMARQLKPPEDE